MATLKVSKSLLAQILMEHFPWPDNTEPKAIEGEWEGQDPVEFVVTAPSLSPESREATPVWHRDSDGTVSFVEWIEWR